VRRIKRERGRGDDREKYAKVVVVVVYAISKMVVIICLTKIHT
jgi:hypothetical protein